MANLYVDIPDVILPTIYPFIGVGIGYANAVLTLNNNSGLLGAVSLRLNSSLFAYQGTAGLTFNFAENFALNASYRYLATNTSNLFGKAFQAQMGDVGVIYRFDMCNYT
jgi:outer membrane autotransporter protein